MDIKGFTEFQKAKQIERTQDAPKTGETAEPVQVEADFDLPPLEIVISAESTEDLKGLLKSAWLEFAGQCSPRISSLMKTLSPKIVGTEVVVETSSTPQTEALEEIRFEFNRFITQKTSSRLLTMRFEQQVPVEGAARKPYTEKEKLDFLIAKKPELRALLERLQLRIP